MNRITYLLPIVIILAGFTGIVSANPAPSCGGSAVFDAVGIGTVGTSISGTIVTYNVAAADTIIGLCVEESDRSKISGITDPQSPPFWTFSHPDSHNYFSYEREGSTQVPLFASQSADVGQADFGSNPLPTNEIYALHVNDPELCTLLTTKKPGTSISTCWIAPGPGTKPVPELSTMVLMVTGLVGLLIVTKKYKK